MIPPAVTDAAIASELPAAIAWAQRHCLELDTKLLTERIIRVVLVQEEEAEQFYLQGRFDDYKALPPIWDWRDENWSKSNEPNLSPRPHDNPLGSMFIQHKNSSIICSHFNRLAFGTNDGPHSDWGHPAQWMTAGAGYIHAVTIGDMLQSILRDFRFTKGRME